MQEVIGIAMDMHLVFKHQNYNVNNLVDLHQLGS